VITVIGATGISGATGRTLVARAADRAIVHSATAESVGSVAIGAIGANAANVSKPISVAATSSAGSDVTNRGATNNDVTSGRADPRLSPRRRVPNSQRLPRLPAPRRPRAPKASGAAGAGGAAAVAAIGVSVSPVKVTVPARRTPQERHRRPWIS